MLPGIKLFDLSERVALITGGSKGLGEAMAEALASAGATVVLASRHGDESEKVASRIESDYGRPAMGVECDVTAPGDTSRMVQQTLQRFGRIDVLINSAGINIRGAIDALSYEDFKRVQETNVNGTWLCCRAVIPHMKRAKWGRLINVASVLGMVGLPNRTPYTSSKGAVVQMTRALALELAPYGINCNALCPGPFLTEMNIPIANTDEARTALIGSVALNRWARLEEIQGAAIYLASDASSYTTGSLLAVDGGWSAR